jgi:hypothetical protein
MRYYYFHLAAAANQGYNDCINRITVPGSHTADYLQGCQDGAAAARIPQLQQPQRTSSDWTLTVRPVNINFGDTNIHIHIKGPFGAYRDDTIANSQDPIDTFSMTESDFPSGYRYQVCISSTAIGFFLPHCQYFTHEDGDETVTISPD